MGRPVAFVDQHPGRGRREPGRAVGLSRPPAPGGSSQLPAPGGSSRPPAPGGAWDGGTDPATDEALRALAEPRRRAILRLVAHQELPAGQIAAAFEVTRTAVSQHLTVLKNAGLLTERRDGTRRLYRARPEGLAGLRQLLDHLWAASLDAARQLVEAERGIVDDKREAAG